MHRIGDYVRSRTDNDGEESYLVHNCCTDSDACADNKKLGIKRVANTQQREGCHEI